MLLQSNIVHAANVGLFKDLSYDLLKDFAHITQLASTPAVLVVHPSLPVKSVKELIALSRQRPMAINFGSAGSGSSSFLAAALFLGAADAKMLHVPYRGGGQALSAIVAGETSVYFSPLGAAMSQIDAGKLRALGVTTSKRFPAVPNYPTVAEAGLPGYEFDNWYGLAAPAKTPPQVITTLHSAVVAILKDPEVNKRLDGLGYIPVGNSPAAFAAYVKSEVDRLRKVAHLLAE
jgi:tripartite-type tricarboxylate transporter receptor subunit TctC